MEQVTTKMHLNSVTFHSFTYGSYTKSLVSGGRAVRIPRTRWLARNVRWRMNRLKHVGRSSERREQAIQSFGIWHVDTHIKTLFILLLYLKGNEQYVPYNQVTSLYMCRHSISDCQVSHTCRICNLQAHIPTALVSYYPDIHYPVNFCTWFFMNQYNKSIKFKSRICQWFLSETYFNISPTFKKIAV